MQPQVRLPAGASGNGLAVVTEIELVLVAGVAVVVAGALLARGLRRRREQRRRHNDEVRARALMGEMCPNGWSAQITLHATAPPGAPSPERGLVSIDWCELPADDGDPPPSRRVWAATIADALLAMVDDRYADEVLERIERMAATDDDPWEAT